jgi:hypothetical protein
MNQFVPKSNSGLIIGDKFMKTIPWEKNPCQISTRMVQMGSLLGFGALQFQKLDKKLFI